MEYVLGLGIGLVCAYLIYLNYTKNKQIKSLIETRDKLKIKNDSIKLELEEKKQLNIKLNGVINQLVLENNHFKNQLVGISKFFKKLTSFKQNNLEGTFGDFNPSSLFNEDIKKEVKKPTYTIDDILTEIGQKGISNISKEKLEFLKNNK